MGEQLKQVLQLFSQPAFLVKEGTVTWCNSAASSLLCEGTQLSSLLEKQGSLFSLWDRTGTLQLSLVLGGMDYDASVRSTPDGELFVASRRGQEAAATAAAVFNASVSLRRPLHTMVSAASTVFEQMEANGSLTQAASRLNQSIYQLIRLSGQMSDGGRLLLHRKEALRRSTDLRGFLNDFIGQAKPLVESLGLTLNCELPASPIVADVDTELLERALYNLLSNAVSYTPKGGTITITTRRQDMFLLFTIRDNGEGISQEVLATLFERYTDHTLGDSRWGLGMGLPMVREIARLHGGTMVVRASDGGQGASVTFTISLERSHNELRSPAVSYNCYGEFHHGLVELSDVLGVEFFDPSEIS